MRTDPIDELLRHQRFLQRLALSLVGDEHAAADLVQDASTAYLQRPPRVTESSRAWLARVVRRLALRRRRTVVRREDRERRAARWDRTDGGLPAVDAQIDAQSQLVEMVRGLPATQREVITMRFSRGRAPREIAGELGVSVHTVNTRLRRALATLRGELDRRAGGDTRAWALMLLPRLGPFETAGPVAASTGAAMGGALAMMTIAKVGVGMVALGVGLWLFWPDDGEPVEADLSHTVSVTAADVLEPAPPATARTRSAATSAPEEPLVPAGIASSEVAVGADTNPWSLEVIVEGAGVEPRSTQVIVTGRIASYAWPEEIAIRTIMEAPGRAAIDAAPLIEQYDKRFARKRALTALFVEIRHPDCPDLSVQVDIVSDGSVDAVPEEPLVAQATLVAGGVVVGRLAPAALEALADAQVIAYPMGEDGPDEVNVVAHAPVDESGAFRLRTPSVGPLALAAIAPGHRPETRLVTIERGTTEDLGVVPIERGLAIDGRLHVDGDAVDQGAQVRAHYPTWTKTWRVDGVPWAWGRSLSWLDGRFEWAWYHVQTDASGAFRFDGLPPREMTVQCTRFGGGTTLTDGIAPTLVVPPATIDLDFGGVTFDVVLDFGDAPAGGGQLKFETPDRSYESRLRADALARDPVLRWATRPGLDVTLRVELDGFEEARIAFEAPDTPGAHASHTLRLVPADPPGRIRLQVTGETPADGMTMQIRLTRITVGQSDPGGELSRSGPLEGGLVLVEDVPAGTYALVTYPARSRGWRESTSLDGETTAEVRSKETTEASCRLLPGGNVRFQARAPEGHLVSLACAVYDADGTKLDTNFSTVMPNGDTYGGGWALTDRGPSSLVRNLPVGRYTVRLHHEDYRDLEAEVEIRAGEITERTFDLIAR